MNNEKLCPSKTQHKVEAENYWFQNVLYLFKALYRTETSNGLAQGKLFHRAIYPMFKYFKQRGCFKNPPVTHSTHAYSRATSRTEAVN